MNGIPFLSKRAWVLIATGVVGFSHFSFSFASANGVDDLAPAIRWLSKSETGVALLERANKYKIPFKPGKVSKTDLTATRVVDQKGERLEFRANIIISVEKKPVFQALDLAHELTHALNPNTNPFDPHLTAKDYIEKGIESKGGEAQAILNECKVGQEILAADVIPSSESETSELIKARCQVVWKKSSDDNNWKSSFYQLGHYYDEFVARVSQLNGKENDVGNWDGKIQTRSPLFSSAVSRKPYPLALLDEYIEITRIICERAKQSALGRSIASASALQGRCNSIGDAN